MITTIKYQLANLGNFNGRDARQTFWYYMLFLAVIQFIAGMVAAMPMYVEMFTGAMDVARSGMNEEAMNARMFEAVAPMLRSQAMIGAGIAVVTSVLFAAAFVRRLHDSGKPGWLLALALVPYLAAQFYTVINIDSVIAATEQAMTATAPGEALASQSKLYGFGVLGWIGYLVVIIFGVMKSDDGPNAYGDAPTRF